jgi:hypothetical protein
MLTLIGVGAFTLRRRLHGGGEQHGERTLQNVHGEPRIRIEEGGVEKGGGEEEGGVWRG